MFYILILRNWIRINVLRITNPDNTLLQITNLLLLRTSAATGQEEKQCRERWLKVSFLLFFDS